MRVTMEHLFQGLYVSHIDFTDLNYKSRQQLPFFDLELEVIKDGDIYNSFEEYIKVQLLEGDNRYDAGRKGLQVAKKHVLFDKFPRVLQLYLKRSAAKRKISYKFPLLLDLDRKNGQYLSREASKRFQALVNQKKKNKGVRNLYTLHSVLVSSNDVHGGDHYAHALIRPTLSDDWYKFNDESVTKVDIKRVLKQSVTGEKTNPKFSHKYAYMLVYVLESDKKSLICNVDFKDIACTVENQDKPPARYNSRKETGYVGLRREGSTCYLNSLLQILYHIPCFRLAVYRIPPMKDDMAIKDMSRALKLLFLSLQSSDTSVERTLLTDSFECNKIEVMWQFDVHDFFKFLSEMLENKMKGSAVEGTMKKLFEGKYMPYIECVNEDYDSQRKEPFYGLQLDTSGCCNVYESFDKYIKAEHPECDDKCHAEEKGLSVSCYMFQGKYISTLALTHFTNVNANLIKGRWSDILCDLMA